MHGCDCSRATGKNGSVTMDFEPMVFVFDPMNKTVLARICTGTGLAPSPHTSAPGLGSPAHICARIGLTSCHICARIGLTPATSAPGLTGLVPAPRSALGQERVYCRYARCKAAKKATAGMSCAHRFAREPRSNSATTMCALFRVGTESQHGVNWCILLGRTPRCRDARACSTHVRDGWMHRCDSICVCICAHD
jgi:hypothetical protein